LLQALLLGDMGGQDGGQTGTNPQGQHVIRLTQQESEAIERVSQLNPIFFLTECLVDGPWI
jgi:hypothetical protein